MGGLPANTLKFHDITLLSLPKFVSVKPRLHGRFFPRDFLKSSSNFENLSLSHPRTARSDSQEKSSKLIAIISIS